MVKPIHKRGVLLSVLDIFVIWGSVPILIFAAVGTVFMASFWAAVDADLSELNLELDDVEFSQQEMEQIWVFLQIMPYYMPIWVVALVFRCGGIAELILYGTKKCIHCQKRVSVIYGRDKTKYYNCKNCGIYEGGQ